MCVFGRKLFSLFHIGLYARRLFKATHNINTFFLVFFSIL